MLEFPEDPTPARRPWSVTRLNREVRDCLEGRIGAVWVEGEISNLRRQPSGHQYFSLKDEACQVSCVMFRGSSLGAPGLRDGLQIELFGELGVYEPRGQYQIVVRRVQPRGAGELEAKLRALQEKLRAEGLFDNARKKPLPAHPVRVGVVTSPAGAAIRDFLHVLARRAPHIEVIIAPVRVQGRGAAAEIAAAITQFADPAGSGFPSVDVIVVTRGGGSLEDLWEFNEETVARAISSSPIPVISAVGHEIDVTTSDLAADVRAPTPSAAAEILSSDRAETLDRLSQLFRRLHRDTMNRLNLTGSHLARLTASGVFQLPARRIAEGKQSADELGERGQLAMQNRLAILRETSLRARTVLQARSPVRQLQTWKERLSSLVQRQKKATATRLRQLQQQHRRHAHALELLGPKQTLARGFTITMDQNRRPLLSASAAAREREIITLFADGEITSRPA
jgi:exodeoxyribonuclease VII large subunit